MLRPLFCLLLLACTVHPSSAQTDRRYVLGERIAFERTPVQMPDRNLPANFMGTSGKVRGPLRTSSVVQPPLSRTHRSGIPQPDSTSGSLFAPISLGLVGGAFGLLLGGVAGARIAEASNCTSWACGLGYPLFGALIGETVGISSGVYVGTDGGNYLLTLLAGAVGTALTLSVASSTDSSKALLAGPVIQLSLTIPMARR